MVCLVCQAGSVLSDAHVLLRNVDYTFLSRKLQIESRNRIMLGLSDAGHKIPNKELTKKFTKNSNVRDIGKCASA